jgi:decaprenyl-phosphate phosphoribosyltransferase
MIRPLWRALRPHQWVKNLLVFAAPAGAGLIDEWPALWRAVVAFVAFCAASSAGYLVNDAIDRDSDRLHPTKSTRPIASGDLDLREARLVALALVGFALASSAAVRAELSAVVAAYLVVTFAYSSFMKRVPWLELVLLASGFLLRAVAGAVAVDVRSSIWFLTVVSATGTFVVTRKRWCEKHAHADSGRTVLAYYRIRSLETLVVVSGAAAVAGHAGWAVEVDGAVTARIVATLAFAAAVARYWWLTRRDDAGGDPVAVLLSDHRLQTAAVVWAAAFLWAAST